jgi:hypothetical protein
MTLSGGGQAFRFSKSLHQANQEIGDSTAVHEDGGRHIVHFSQCAAGVPSSR